eukprot:96616_1
MPKPFQTSSVKQTLSILYISLVMHLHSLVEMTKDDDRNHRLMRDRFERFKDYHLTNVDWMFKDQLTNKHSIIVLQFSSVSPDVSDKHVLAIDAVRGTPRDGDDKIVTRWRLITLKHAETFVQWWREHFPYEAHEYQRITERP